MRSTESWAIWQSQWHRSGATGNDELGGCAAGLPVCFPQAPLSYKDRSSRTPWHYVPRDDDFALAKHVRQSMYLRNHETQKKGGCAARLPVCFPQAPLSYKDRCQSLRSLPRQARPIDSLLLATDYRPTAGVRYSSRTPWHYVPRDDDFALAMPEN